MATTIKKFTFKDFGEALHEVRGYGSHLNPAAAAAAGPDQFYAGPTPQELHEIYSGGFRGIKPETQTFEEKQQFKDFMAKQPSLYEAYPWAKDIGKGKVSAPFLATLKFIPTWGGDEAQEGGDCTVHSTANAGEADHCNDALWGETEFKGRLCKEHTYRHRGFNGDGWSCEAPAYYLGPEGQGGNLYRKVYTNGSETVDLSKYNRAWELNGKAGVPAWLEAEAKKSKIKWIIPISSMPEYRDAIAMGFGVSVCSGQGFADTTDEFGVAAARGSWSHAMSHQVVVDTEWAHSKYEDMIGGIQQQWGRWNTQRGKPEGVPVLPVGMFFSKANTIASMIKGQDSFALCGVWGWDRTGWEAFDITDHLSEHLHDSTVEDYYKHRSEKAAELVVEAMDTNMFLAI